MRISMKEMLHNLDGPPKNKELWSYVVIFEFSRSKSSSPDQQFLHFLYRQSADVGVVTFLKRIILNKLESEFRHLMFIRIKYVVGIVERNGRVG